ncbi:MAG: T9SS type A sorting domain-containing protein [Bacteroidetes bacterium]|nr:T9SS type A sorting domain-containing protein [Bacteroidota bacterium]
MRKYIFCWMLLSLTCFAAWSQNETTKWYFGSVAGVDFMSGTPVALTNSVMGSSEGSASIAGPGGNLLFYTNGNTVWNANHVAMLNGSGLFGSSISCQSAVIVRQPGSANLYYVFTMRNWTDGGNGAHYSIVDMSLAAGLGDVTTKNQLIYGNTRESLTAVCHANGTDYWIVIHDMFTNEFHSYLLTATGLAAVPVISAVGSVFSGGNRYGALKASPDGTKLGYALGGSGGVTTELYDFNRTTGLVSNSLTLNNGTFSNAYGIEFSPNSLVLYVTQYNGSTIQQFNLAAGSPALIVSSNTVISTGANVKANLQTGPDGKIYVCLAYQAFLASIDNPNTVGVGCGFVNNSVNLAGRTCGLGLPNFMPCLLPVILPETEEVSHSFANTDPVSEDVEWTCFPNPIPEGGHLNLRAHEFEGQLEWELSDAQQKPICRKIVAIGDQTDIALDFPELSAGLYFLKVRTRNGAQRTIRLLQY